MKPRGLAVLGVLAVLSVAATAAVLRTGTPTIASDRRGELVMPGLADKANDISGLTIHQDGDTLRSSAGIPGSSLPSPAIRSRPTRCASSSQA
jgi:hypothetical protein